MASREPLPSTVEKPENGLRGLKHWRYDLIAGLQVALIGLPLSLGIAAASGAPPIAGVISAILAGLALPFLGGAYVTIGGPAAGLAPALLAGMLTLGQGDMRVGYPLLLVAIYLTGLVQILLSFFQAGRFGMYFPISVVKGMLASIGLLIIIEQIPSLLGHVAPPIKSIPKSVLLVPEQVLDMNPRVFVIGVAALLALIVLYRNKDQRWAAAIPPPLLVVCLGSVAGWWLQLPAEYLIRVPHDILGQGIQVPHFYEALQRMDLWMALATTTITLTLIDGTESLATIAAVDKIDPFRRKSDPNGTLRAVGVSNVLSSLAGGLTIIPGGIKSATNILAGGRTLWANFYFALFLSLFLWLGTSLINRIPRTVLAAWLIFIGWQLCAPKVFLKILSIGREQLLVGAACVMTTLYTSDLLTGVALGTLTKIVVLSLDAMRASPREARVGASFPASFSRRLASALKTVFGNPVIRIGDGRIGGNLESVMSVATNSVLGTGGMIKHPYKIYLSSVTCMNLAKLDSTLRAIVPLPNTREHFMIILAGHVVDHTAMEYLHHFQDHCMRAGHSCVIVGVQHFRAFSDHVLAYRVHQSRNIMAYA